LRKTRFFSKNSKLPVFLKFVFFVFFFKKKQVFVLFSKKTQKPVSEIVFIALSGFS